VCVLLVSALAQSWRATEPPPAATGPGYDVSAGYSCLAMGLPGGGGHVNLNGIDLNAHVDVGPRWGISLD